MAYKMTEQVVNRLEDALKLGASYTLACKYAGITYATYRNWMNRGEAEMERRDSPRVKPGSKQWDDEQEYVNFVDRMHAAEGDAGVRWLARIEKGAEKHWQAAAWKLERRYPEDYGKQVTQLETPEGGLHITVRWPEQSDD